MDIERRHFNSEIRIEEREGDQLPRITGYAAVFDKLSENLGGFREKIAPGAFDNILGDDVRALFNHDANHVLGRTKSGTLAIGIDANGLTYSIDPPDTQSARDLMASMKRGDIDQSSFGFTVDDDDWVEDDDGRTIRTIKKVSRLYDVSPVTYPAYPDTSAATRSLDKFKESQKPDFSLHLKRLEMAEADT